MKKNDKLLFLGTSVFAATIFTDLIKSNISFDIIGVITRPDSRTGRGRKLGESPVKTIAKDHQISVYQPENKKDLTNLVTKLNPDIAIVAAYGMIIPQEALEVPRLGFLNVHGSILPKYRGASPVASALLAEDKESGVTIIKMNERMDEGDILKINKISILLEDNAETLMHRLAILGGETLIQLLPDYRLGKLTALKQDDSTATYCKLVTKNDGMINKNDTADSVLSKIKAYYPWPGVFFVENNLTFKIIKATISKEKLYPLEIKIIDSKLYLGTKTNAVEILQLQPESKKIMASIDYLNGIKKRDS